MTIYTILEKDTRNNKIAAIATFTSRKSAEIWVDGLSQIWEEERGYKIVEGTPG